jgi:hypothetical protein
VSNEAGPGWFPDPEGGSGLRYWDGSGWTEHRHPPVAPAPPITPVYAPPSPTVVMQPRAERQTWPMAALVGVVVASLFAAVLFFTVGNSDSKKSTTSTPPAAPATTEPHSVAASSPGAFVPYPVRVREVVATAASMPELYAVPAGGAVVTPDSAQAVASAIWGRRAIALAARDTAALRTFETGSALAVDSDRCSCGAVNFGAARAIAVSVPRGQAYPAHFLAEVRSTLNHDQWLALLVITRASADQPWRVAFQGGFTPAQPHIAPRNDPDGYAAAVDPAVNAIAQEQPVALATYWQGWKNHGAAPTQPATTWRSGPMTDGYGRHIAGVGLQGEVNQQNGLVGHYRYQALAGAAYVFPIEADALFVCAPVQRQAQWTAADGSRSVVQNPNRSNWGADVAPGRYRSMLQDDIASPCIVTYVSGPLATDDVVGTYPDSAATVPIP